MDLCMKELAYGKKIIYEEMQQNINYLPQQNTATNNYLFSTSNSVFSSLPLNSFTTTTTFNKPQNISQSQKFSHFSQQKCPPPTIFDPFAANVAANFMQHFTQNNQQQSTNTQQNNSLQSFQPRELAPIHFNNFGFPQFGADFSSSPSYGSLNSAGTSAVDSLSSSGIPSSPDNSSCSLDAEILILNEFKKNNELNKNDNQLINKNERFLCQRVNYEEIIFDEHIEKINENKKIKTKIPSPLPSINDSQDEDIIIIEYKTNQNNKTEIIKENFESKKDKNNLLKNNEINYLKNKNKEDLVTDSSLSLSSSNNNSLKEEIILKEENQRKVLCRWIKCKEMFFDEDGLYDHLISAHIDSLTKLVISEQREIEKQQKSDGGVKRRRFGSFISIENTKERFRCQWRKCEQFPRRGDSQKKLDWLLNHLFVRHLPKSRPHKCLFEECSLRFSKIGALRDHIRCAHNENNNKQNGKKSFLEENNIKISCFEFRPFVHFPFVNDFIDSRTIEWTRNGMINCKKQQKLIF
ncbi:hypothetical protein ACQ4LE_002358, partial [Meloidogyne hapla]